MLDWLVWLTILIFSSIRYIAHFQADEMPAVLEHLGDTNLDILGGFLSFLLVIYVNQTNTRFFDMYALAKACAGRVQDVVGLVSTIYPTNTSEGQAAATRMLRYVNAALQP